MAPFIKYLVFNCFHILLYVVRDYLFPLPYHVLLCECTINLSTLLLMGIWVVSSLLPWALLFMGFGAGMYTLLLDTRSGIARHGVSMCSALENSASSSPEWFCHELHSDHVESECF